LAPRVYRALKVQQGLKAHREQMAPLARKGQPVPKVRKGFPDLKGLKDQQVRRVLRALVFPAHKDLKGRRDLRVWGGLPSVSICTIPTLVTWV
jgi:hypothetical protein